ncbi:MAG: hypothetical protein AB1726_07870 [Planctomycetota bacterium]
MDAVPDFEDLLILLHSHGVQYLIVGGLAVTYHARPRYTKDMDIWVGPDPDNVDRANRALAEFGSPTLLDPGDRDQVLQIGLPPNRIDLLLDPGPVGFPVAWRDRIESTYGEAPANWIGLDALLEIKSSLDHPRHAEDARVLREVKRRRDG